MSSRANAGMEQHPARSQLLSHESQFSIREANCVVRILGETFRFPCFSGRLGMGKCETRDCSQLGATRELGRYF